MKTETEEPLRSSVKHKTEMEESLRSSLNHEKAEAQADVRRKQRQKELIVPFYFVASSASVELTSQTSKCEPVMTEAQAETGGWAVSVSASASAAGVNQA